mmetsp:Transcript_26032/g.65713  ORF Transcript_26032/g.65713 Transcript_26032/m.65713 type:complete len:214 (+) Transcript_26032:473-1114(+)
MPCTSFSSALGGPSAALKETSTTLSSLCLTLDFASRGPNTPAIADVVFRLNLALPSHRVNGRSSHPIARSCPASRPSSLCTAIAAASCLQQRLPPCPAISCGLGNRAPPHPTHHSNCAAACCRRSPSSRPLPFLHFASICKSPPTWHTPSAEPPSGQTLLRQFPFSRATKQPLVAPVCTGVQRDDERAVCSRAGTEQHQPEAWSKVDWKEEEE